MQISNQSNLERHWLKNKGSSMKAELKKYTKVLNRLMVWNQYDNNANSYFVDSQNWLKYIDLLEKLEFFSSIEVLCIKDNSIIFLISYPPSKFDGRDNVSIEKTVSIEEFYQLFVKGDLVSINENKKEIKDSFTKLIRGRRIIGDESRTITDMLKSKVEALLH